MGSYNENEKRMSHFKIQGNNNIIGGQQRQTPYSRKDTLIPRKNVSSVLSLLVSLLNDQSVGDEQTITETDDEERRRQSSSEDQKCQRFVFLPSQEERFQEPELLHYFIASKLFYQNLMMIKNPDLPRKNITNPWDALNSVVYIRNPKLEMQFEAMKSKFKSEGKVNAFGDVHESMLFHGTSNEALNQIVENNFSLEQLPSERGKLMFFGRGIYFSQLPGVSLMYGTGLLLCKVILGKCERYFPNGATPPEIPEGFDSRVIIRDGQELVTVVKRPEQILPYCCLHIKQERIVQAGAKKKELQAKMVRTHDLGAASTIDLPI